MNGLWNTILRIFRSAGQARSGFTAIETTVGLFAALATAGTISSVVISSANDTSQEVDQAVRDTIANIEGTFIIKGSVYGKAAVTGNKGVIDQITLDVALVCDDGSIDFTPPTASSDNNGLAGTDSANLIMVSYSDENQHIDDLYWTVTPLGRDDGDLILDGGELFQITIGGSLTPGQMGGNLADALTTDLSGDTEFKIEIGAPQGATAYFEGHTPTYLKKVNCFQ